jgi:hypothetical protein
VIPAKANIMAHIARPRGLRNRFIRMILACVSWIVKWQPEYQTRSYQINHLAMAPSGRLCRFFRPGILFRVLPLKTNGHLSLNKKGGRESALQILQP